MFCLSFLSAKQSARLQIGAFSTYKTTNREIRQSFPIMFCINTSHRFFCDYNTCHQVNRYMQYSALTYRCQIYHHTTYSASAWRYSSLPKINNKALYQLHDKDFSRIFKHSPPCILHFDTVQRIPISPQLANGITLDGGQHFSFSSNDAYQCL